MNKNKDTLEEIFDLAVKNHKSKHYKIAEDLYNKILIKKPQNIQTIFLLGTLFTETNNFNSGIPFIFMQQLLVFASKFSISGGIIFFRLFKSDNFM